MLYVYVAQANNSVRFCIRVYNDRKEVVQYNFQTQNGKRITQVIQDHVDVLLKQRTTKYI